MLVDIYEFFSVLKNTSVFKKTVPVNVNFLFGKVCGENVYTSTYLPMFNNSAVDGYALNLKNVCFASDVNKIFLKVKPFCEGVFFNDFFAIEIMTGAKVPFNFDVIIKIEDVIVFDFKKFSYIIISKKLVKNENIRFIGEDFYPGFLMCFKGSVIDLYKVTILYSFCYRFINVFSSLKIALFSTGDEIKSCLVNNSFSNLYCFSLFSTSVYQIKNSAAIFILNFFKQLEIIVDYYGCVRDNVDSIVNCFNIILKDNIYNIILSTGAVSKGKHDFVLQSFCFVGGNVLIHGLNVKPGKPLLFGTFSQNCVFFGLPGNILATIFCIRFFVFYFILKNSVVKNYEEIFSFFLSKKKKWSFNFLYFIKAHFFIFSNNFYSTLSFDQESFKLNSLLSINSISLLYNNGVSKKFLENAVVRSYCLYPSLI